MALMDRLRLLMRLTRDARYPEEWRIPWSPRTLAGVPITPDTAITISAAWACLRYLSQMVAVLPWRVMREAENGGELARTHPVDWLLWKRPNPEWSSFQVRETLTHWALRHGNGYAEIERNPVSGLPVAMWPLHPDRVDPQRLVEGGELVYAVSNGIGGTVIVPAMDMFHVRGFGDGPVGISVVAHAGETLGWAKAAQLFGASFFGNGMNVAGVVQVKAGMQETGIKRLTAALENLYKGVRKSNKVAILDAGSEWKPVGVEPEKAQFIGTNQHLVEEVCRIFGVPPHKVMHLLRATFSNIEQQGIEAVTDCISPWVKRFEEEADYKLFGQNRPGYYTKMNMNALMRGDSQARAGFYQILRNVGALTVNDILRLEDMNTISEADGGNMRVMQGQYVPLDQLGAPPVPAAPPPAANDQQPTPDEQRQMAALLAQLERVNA